MLRVFGNKKYTFNVLDLLTNMQRFSFLISNVEYAQNIKNVSINCSFINVIGDLFEKGVFYLNSTFSQFLFNSINLKNCSGFLTLGNDNFLFAQNVFISTQREMNLINIENNNNLNFKNFVIQNNNCSSFFTGNDHNIIKIFDLIVNCLSQNCSQTSFFSLNNSNIIEFNHSYFQNISGNIFFQSNSGNNTIKFFNSKFDNINFSGQPFVFFLNFNDSFIFQSSIIHNLTIQNQNESSLISAFHSHIVMIDCIFSQICYPYGFLINITQGKVNITSSIIQEGTFIGLISAQQSIIEMNKVFFQNITGGVGSLVSLLDDCFLLIKDSIFSSISSSSSNENDEFCGGFLVAFNQNHIGIENSSILNLATSNFGQFVCLNNLNFLNITNVKLYNSSSSQKMMIFSNSNQGIITSCHFIEIFGMQDIGITLDFNNSILVSKSRFLNFLGYVESGGVFILNLQNTIQINHSLFFNISSFSGSGLKIIDNNIVELFNITCDFHINQNHNFFGGIIYINSENQINITNSIFSNSIAPNGGAGISATSQNTINLLNVKFNNLTLRGNTRGQGGIIYLYSLNILNIANSSFSNSFGYFGGGIFCTENNIISITSSFFLNLSSMNQSSSLGGWIMNKYYVSDSVFFNNTCYSSGGVFYIDTNSSVFFQNVICVNSLSYGEGGVFYIQMGNVINITSSYFTESYAQNSGGMFYINSFNNVSINYSNFSQSQTANAPGVIFYLNTNNMLIGVNNFLFNIILTGDGGFVFLNSNNTLINSQSTYLNFQAEELIFFGAIIYGNEFSNISLISMQIKNVGGLFSGGIVYLSDFNTIFGLEISVENVDTYFAGSFLYFYQFNNATFDTLNLQNFVCKYYGLFYAYTNNSFFITNSHFSNITTTVYDGGIFFVFQFNFVFFQTSMIENVVCKGYGCFAHLVQFNTMFLIVFQAQNLYSKSSIGDALYCENKNDIRINESYFNNDGPLKRYRNLP